MLLGILTLTEYKVKNTVFSKKALVTDYSSLAASKFSCIEVLEVAR